MKNPFNRTAVTHILLQWLPFAVLATLMCGLIYGTVQQAYRQGANDPQVQIALDVARALENGAPPEVLVPAESGVVDMQQSLAPYIIIYNADLQPIAGVARLHDTIPTPPAGVFDHAKANGENRITWEPEPGVRSAIVLRSYGGEKPGFVLIGRSLSEIENRTQQMFIVVIIGWIISLVVLLGISALVNYKMPHRNA
jgi:hypothetical protein